MTIAKKVEEFNKKLEQHTHDGGFLYCEDEDHIEFEPIDFDVEVMASYFETSLRELEEEAKKVNKFRDRTSQWRKVLNEEYNRGFKDGVNSIKKKA